MGRPSKLTPKRADAILSALAAGSTCAGAAAAGGISERTLRSWVERGRRGESPYAGFVERYDVAWTAAEAAWITRIAELGTERADWRAFAWLLERRFPGTWGSRASVQHAVAAPAEDHGAFWRDLARQCVEGVDAAG